MKKIATKAIPLACAVTAPLFMNADEQEASMLYAASMPNLTNSKLATSTGMQSAKSAVQTQPSEQVTPPAGPLVSNGADVYVTADFLWWKAEQAGLQYAYNGGQNTAITGTTNATKGNMHEPDFSYEPGFKVGLGVLCEHDNWDLFAQYTWLNVDNSDTHSHAADHGATNRLHSTSLITGVDGATSLPAFESMHASWALKFNVLDVELGRNYWISKRLTLRPFVGMKFSWLEQHYRVEGDNLLSGSSFTTTDLNHHHNLKEFGVGLRGGINTAFYMWNKWSIYGDLAFTSLWNSLKASREDTNIVAETDYRFLDTHLHTHPVTAVMELGVGLRFETIFSKGRYMYMLQAGWEDQVWFNQGAFVQLPAPATAGNLSISGLTIKTGFYF